MVATDRLVPSILLIAFLAIGVEALRRQVVREFPDHVATGTPEGMAHALAAQMEGSREERVAAASEEERPPPPPASSA